MYKINKIVKSTYRNVGAFYNGGKMLEKPKRPKKFNNLERQLPKNIQELVNRYDLENLEIYDFLDKLVDYLNERGI